MRVVTDTRPVGKSLTVPAWGLRAVSLQLVLLMVAAWVLPAGAHLAGLPVRQLLPMHWPVVLAGLVYGWRAGLLIGLLAPCVSFLISGMPLPHILPAMTVELAAYGFLAGFGRQILRWNGFFATLLSLAGGRLVFVAMALATGAAQPSLTGYLLAALAPGWAAALGQSILLPILANAWTRHETAAQPAGERRGSE